MLDVEISISTFDFAGSLSLYVIVPLMSPKRPRTVEIIRCLTANSTCECVGSTDHVVVVPAVGVAAVVMVVPRGNGHGAENPAPHCLHMTSDYTFVSSSCQVSPGS